MLNIQWNHSSSMTRAIYFRREGQIPKRIWLIFNRSMAPTISTQRIKERHNEWRTFLWSTMSVSPANQRPDIGTPEPRVQSRALFRPHPSTLSLTGFSAGPTEKKNLFFFFD